jgi:hypothetical protein
VIAQPMRFPYTQMGAEAVTLMPRLALTLRRGQRSIDILGLLDTGAAVSVLPYSVGVDLGADWDQQAVAMVILGVRIGQSTLTTAGMQPQEGYTLSGAERTLYGAQRHIG